jgi:hypothetical protein
MRKWTYIEVNYQGRVRFSTLNQQEGENYARSLWARDGQVGAAPELNSFERTGK